MIFSFENVLSHCTWVTDSVQTTL